MRITHLFAIVGLIGCTGTSVPPSRPAQVPLKLEVEIDTRKAGDPVATIRMLNVGVTDLAVTRTFGLERSFLRIQLETSDGARIYYPENSQFELFSRPRFVCLRPGRETTVEFRLNHWYHLIGGKLRPEQAIPEEGPYSFRVVPGSYRIKAAYHTSQGRKGVPCPPPPGIAESPWVYFDAR